MGPQAGIQALVQSHERPGHCHHADRNAAACVPVALKRLEIRGMLNQSFLTNAWHRRELQRGQNEL